jgi:hypothetical protein
MKPNLAIPLAVCALLLSLTTAAFARTITEVCGTYSKLHANSAAYDAAQKIAFVYECAVIGKENIAWQNYPLDSARSQTAVDDAKSVSLSQMTRRYPGIPNECASGMLGIAYLVISKHSNVKNSCIDAAAQDEVSRQLGE